MKKKKENIPAEYAKLRSVCLDTIGATRWRFEWFTPGPDFGAPARTAGAPLKRFNKRSCNEKFVNKTSADEFIRYKQKELNKIWEGKGDPVGA